MALFLHFWSIKFSGTLRNSLISCRFKVSCYYNIFIWKIRGRTTDGKITKSLSGINKKKWLREFSSQKTGYKNSPHNVKCFTNVPTHRRNLPGTKLNSIFINDIWFTLERKFNHPDENLHQSSILIPIYPYRF